MNHLFITGWIAGVFVRSLIPYLIRVFQGQTKFEVKYLRSAVVSLAAGIMSNAIILPQTMIVYTSPLDAVWAGFGIGFIVQTAAQWQIKEQK